MFDRREYMKEYKARYYEANKEKLREYGRNYSNKYRADNRDLVNRKQRVKRCQERIQNGEPLDKRAREVIQLDYYTGEVVETYATLREAAEDNYLNESALCKALANQGGVLKRRELVFAYK